MKLLFKIFLVTGLVLVILVPAGLVLVAIDSHPHVRTTRQISREDIDRAGQILNRLTPENVGMPQNTSLVVSQKDLNLLVGYGLTRAVGTGGPAAEIHLFESVAIVYATIQLPVTFLGKWVNVAMVVTPHPEVIEIKRVQIGGLPVPATLAQWLAGHAHTRLMKVPRYANVMALAKKIQAIDIDTDRLALDFQWDPDLAATLTAEAKKQAFSIAHQKRLAEYYNVLVELSRSFQRKETSLINLMKPMFMHALENTAISRDPVAENTAVLQVLATHAMNQDPAEYLTPKIREMLDPSRPAVVFLLLNREDLAQHLLGSAAMTILGSDQLAGSMGLAKEMEDARSGSGFSFVDMAANKAGIRMGRFAVSGPVNARFFQQRMADISHENQFMPDIGNLPENMDIAEFKARFTDTHSFAYLRIMDMIESRIDACPIYQN
jgi:hypothetical protein